MDTNRATGTTSTARRRPIRLELGPLKSNASVASCAAFRVDLQRVDKRRCLGDVSTPRPLRRTHAPCGFDSIGPSLPHRLQTTGIVHTHGQHLVSYRFSHAHRLACRWLGPGALPRRRRRMTCLENIVTRWSRVLPLCHNHHIAPHRLAPSTSFKLDHHEFFPSPE